MIVNNVARTSVSFAGVPRPGAIPKMPTEITPDSLKKLLESYATRDKLEYTTGSVKRINEKFTNQIDTLIKRVDDLEAGQTGNLAGQVRVLTERLDALENSGVQNGSMMKFISNHKAALGASAAAILAVGIAGFAYSKHNKKLQAERDAADPALYAPTPVSQTPQPAAVEAPAPSAPVSSSLNDYFVKTA